MIRWVYTDEIVEKQNEDFLLTLMKTAKRFELKELIDQYVEFIDDFFSSLIRLTCLSRCEVNLISTINVRNCLKFYKVAEEIGAQVLQSHCSQLISTHWVRSMVFIEI